VVILVLPAFNEADAIVPLLARVQAFVQRRALDLRVIVVDDGSKDDTAAAVRSFKGLAVELIQHPQNRGLAEAIKTGLSAAVARCKDDDVIVTMDADDTHAPALMGRMLDRIAEGYNLVIASRYLPESRVVGLSAWRTFLSWAAGVLFRVTFPITGVRDYTCGYRAYRMDLLHGMAARFRPLVRARGFAVMTELLAKAAAEGARCEEVPLVLRYDLKPGRSKLRVLPTLAEYGRVLLLARLDIARTAPTASVSGRTAATG
jgi:dolichol-phosphate mannosyltransferase